MRESAGLNNYYAVILLPTTWQYEWMEAFLHIMGNEELMFSDFEGNSGKRGYSRVGDATTPARWQSWRRWRERRSRQER